MANVRNFIEGNPVVANLFMSDGWENLYTNDVGSFTSQSQQHWNPANRKEVNYISGVANNLNGYTTRFKIGVVSNLTDNYFTNISPGDVTSWCYDNPIAINVKNNLSWGDLTVISSAMGDYFYDWYDYEGYYLSSTTYYLHDLGYFPHPISCVENNCNTLTSEIPFVLEWDYADINKSNPIGLDTQNVNSVTEEIPTIQLYPNPTNDFIIIRCSDLSINEFHLLDAKGQLIQTLNSEQIKNSLPVTNLEPGFYVIIAIDESNLTKHKISWVKN